MVRGVWLHKTLGALGGLLSLVHLVRGLAVVISVSHRLVGGIICVEHDGSYSFADICPLDSTSILLKSLSLKYFLHLSWYHCRLGGNVRHSIGIISCTPVGHAALLAVKFILSQLSQNLDVVFTMKFTWHSIVLMWFKIDFMLTINEDLVSNAKVLRECMHTWCYQKSVDSPLICYNLYKRK